MIVFYFLQGELGESMECPNAFVAPGGSLTFGEFLQHFPMLDKSSMHFRFRTEDPNFGYVWEDISEAGRTLPIYQGNVFAKILRIENDSTEKRKIILKRKNFDPTNPLIQSVQAQVNRTTQSKPSVVRSSEESSKQVPLAAPPKPAKVPPRASTNVDPPTPSNTQAKPAAAPAPEPNFFDTDPTTPGPAAASYSPPPDILNFDDSVPVASSSAKIKSSTGSSRSPVNLSAAAMDIDDDNSSSIRGAGGELNRAELAARKEEAIEDKVRSALEFKKEVDQKKEKEQLEFDSAKAKHEQALNTWASNNKEKRNVRTLLSTMQNVLPSDSKWKPLGLGDVLEPSQVKKAYRKAMLVVHPDHCINLDSEHKFICKRVFEALNEAYDEFTKKENV